MSKHTESEIDILSLLKMLWGKKVIILIVTLLCGIAGWLVSAFFITPTYTSTTKIYVVSQQSAETALTAQDLQAGSYLVKDYQQIITSESVLGQAISESGVDLSIKQLSQKVAVEVPSDTRIVTIRIEDEAPERAAVLANAVRTVAADKIREVTKVSDVTTLEEAKTPLAPSAPNKSRNALLAMIAGTILVTLIILALELLNDRVRKPEDIEENLGFPLLAVIPDTDKL